ncbi:MAG: pectate lyase [Alicyclobacillus macrosporangiidus]|nr:pectate lyase [Alicyclobacillus macrosporangiidus]
MANVGAVPHGQGLEDPGPQWTGPGGAIDLGRQVLPKNDGWAAYGTGTTGGSAATPDHVYVVHDRSELVNALENGSSTPKIIYVVGTIDANVDDNNQPLQDPVAYYAQGTGYTLQAYLQAYDPNVWRRDQVPSGPMEAARAQAEQNQAKRVQFNVGSNTTIVGVGRDAKIVGGNLVIGSNVDNVIVRNIEFQDAIDYFPQWDPTDGDTGNWNALFDSITIKGGSKDGSKHGATHVWIDHCTFDDGAHPDDQAPVYFGRPYEQHDGAVDITNGADYVTVSYCVFRDHDKTNLIGSTDSPTYDVNHLHVTFHHDLYENVVQRLPRVRYGQVHVYNNLYIGTDGNASYPLSYAFGVGVQSAIYAQNNFFVLPQSFDPADLIHDWNGTDIHVEGSWVAQGGKVAPADLLALYNKKYPSQPLGSDVGWRPTLYTHIDPTVAVPALVWVQAGAGKLPSVAPQR